MWSQISKEFLTWADIKSELMVYTQPYSHYSIYRRDSIVYVANFPFLLAIRICLLSRQSPLSTLAAPYRANWEAEEGRPSSIYSWSKTTIWNMNSSVWAVWAAQGSQLKKWIWVFLSNFWGVFFSTFCGQKNYFF